MDKVIEIIRQTAAKYPCIQRVILFGSRARGDFNDNSDYDIAVFGADEETRLRLSSEIDELPTLCKIDVLYADDSYAGTPIYDNILREGKLIMRRFLEKLYNYKSAVARLSDGVRLAQANFSDMMQDAVIQRFEFTSELAWKTIREYLIEQGEIGIDSPKPVMRAAFRTHLISNEQGWIAILDDRNITSHIYKEEEAKAVYDRIASKHLALFQELLEQLLSCIENS